jgi:hypothetical protein
LRQVDLPLRSPPAVPSQGCREIHLNQREAKVYDAARIIMALVFVKEAAKSINGQITRTYG